MFTKKGDTVLRCAFLLYYLHLYWFSWSTIKKINKSKRTRKKSGKTNSLMGKQLVLSIICRFFYFSIQSNRQLPELRVKQLAKRGTISNSHQIVIQTNNVSLALLIVHIFRLVWPLFSFIWCQFNINKRVPDAQQDFGKLYNNLRLQCQMTIIISQIFAKNYRFDYCKFTWE